MKKSEYNVIVVNVVGHFDVDYEFLLLTSIAVCYFFFFSILENK